MNRRILLPITFILLALMTLTLAACERDRPVEKQATAVPARGTVAPSPTPAAGDATAGTAAPTSAPAAEGAATPTAPAPQPASAGQESSGAAAESTSGGATTGQATTYTVAAGDTLAAIAKKFGVTQAALVEANNLADPNKLVLGQQLQIPAGGVVAAAAAGATAGSAGAGSATTGAAATGAAAGATGTYVVERGDTLGQIAQKYSTTVAELMKLNGLSNPDRIAVGQKLTVPGGGGQAAQPAATTSTGQTRSYTVQKGDTLLSIARRFGLTVKQLQAANNITNPDKIFPGQTLTIP